MKKLVLSFVLVLGSLSLVSAQQNAIGLKLGYGVDASYQHSLSDANRVEFNVGLSSLDNGYLAVGGLYQWIFPLTGEINWYAGAGVGAGFGNDFSLSGLGNIGIEWNLGIPLQLAIDWTPAVNVVGNTGAFHWEGFRFGIRYRF